MWELIRAGGAIMLPLGLLWLLALGVIGERLWTLRRSKVLPPKLTAEVQAWARSARIERQHIDVLRQNSPLGAVLAEIVANRNRAREVIRSKAEDAGRQVVHELGRFLNLLGTIAIISPLMGLLGTVFGLIRMFLVVNEGGMGDAQRLAGGIGEALVATASGLTVAIIAYFAHRYFRGLIVDFAVAMEREANTLIDALEQPDPAAAPARTERTEPVRR